MIHQGKNPGHRLMQWLIPLVFLAAGSAGTAASNDDLKPATVPSSSDLARYDQTVAERRQAFEKDGSTHNQMKLAEAESQAADAHVALARQCYAQRQLNDARKELITALELVPAHPEAITLARTVDRQIKQSDDLARQAGEAQQKNDPASALKLAEQALAIDPTQPAAMKVRDDAQVTLLDEQYERHALAGKWELAWPLAVEAAAIKPADDASALQNMARAEEAIRNRIAYRLRIVPLPSNSVEPAGVLAIARALADELDRIKPAHVRLLSLETTTDALAGRTIRLADVTDPAKLKTLDPHFAENDLCLFVDAVAQDAEPKPAGPTGQNASPQQAAIDLQQARQALSRARQLALADESKWDAEARRTLATDETFLPKAAAGTFGLQAQRAAEDYNAALRRLQQAPAGGPRSGQSANAAMAAQRRVEVQARLRLVQATTGRVFFSDDETEGQAIQEPPASAPAGARPTSRSVADLHKEAIRQMAPALQNKAREVLLRHAMAYFEEASKAKGDEAAAGYVRFLFDCSSDPGPHLVALAVDDVLGRQVTGQRLQAGRTFAAGRLKLRIGPSAATQPAPTIASAKGTMPPAATSAALQDRQPSAQTGRISSAPLPARTGRATPKPPAPVSVVPTAPPAAGPPKPSPSTMVSSPTPAYGPAGTRIFDGYISNHDKRFPKKQAVTDGISVEVRDTDRSPLDADLRIAVGTYSGKFKGLHVGTRLRIRGASGQEYRLTVIGIDDQTETVHLSVDRLPSV